MSHINLRLKTICCFCGLIILCTSGVQALALPSDPNNAALLYYQAFLFCPEPNYAEQQLIYNIRAEKIYDLLCGGQLEFDPNIDKNIRELEDRLKNDSNEPDEIPLENRKITTRGFFDGGIQFRLSMLREQQEHEQKMRGVDPNKTIRNYMKKCRDAIELANAASKLPICDWGIMYSQGLACRLPQLVEIRRFTRILCTDALILASDGNFHAAFESCLMTRRFAYQVGDDAYLLYCVSQATDNQALRCIQILLGYTKLDIDTLTWLKTQLVIEGGFPTSPIKALKIDFEMALQSLRTNAELLENTRQALGKKNEIKSLMREQTNQDDGNAIDMQRLTDEELVILAGKPYATFLDSAIRVIESEMSYEKKRSEIQRLTESLQKKFYDDFGSKLEMLAHPEGLLRQSIVMACAEQVLRIYDVHVRYTSHFNALMTGIEVYLVQAKTGQLPERLPEGVPKDPFTGRDFTYKITEDGFELSLPRENIPEQKHRPYKFKVQK